MRSQLDYRLAAGCVVIALLSIAGFSGAWRTTDSRPAAGSASVLSAKRAPVFSLLAEAGADMPASADERNNGDARHVGAERMEALRTKLAEWRETETGDAAAQARIVEAWLALLDDATAGEVVMALSEEDLATPLGVAAFDRWLKLEPEDALAWTRARGRVAIEETRLVVQALLDTPARIPAFCERLPDGDWTRTFLEMAALQAVEKDPGLALDLAKRLGAGATQTNVLQTLTYAWMMRDPDAATRWLLTVDDPGLREKLVSSGAKAIAMTDPDLAPRWMAIGIKTEPAFVDTALCVAEIWAERDPAKAVAWVAQFPPGQARNAAIDSMCGRWLEADPVVAEAGIKQLPGGTGVLARIEASARTVDSEAD